MRPAALYDHFSEVGNISIQNCSVNTTKFCYYDHFLKFLKITLFYIFLKFSSNRARGRCMWTFYMCLPRACCMIFSLSMRLCHYPSQNCLGNFELSKRGKKNTKKQQFELVPFVYCKSIALGFLEFIPKTQSCSAQIFSTNEQKYFRVPLCNVPMETDLKPSHKNPRLSSPNMLIVSNISISMHFCN